MTISRRHIFFKVCLCSRFQCDPKKYHLTIVKRTFRYLSGTINVGLFYYKFLEYKLVGYCDDYVRDKLKSKTTRESYPFKQKHR